MSVKIALGVVDSAVRMNGKDPAVIAVSAVIPVDKSVGGFKRRRLSFGPPPEKRGMRKDIDLTRLHHCAPRRRVERRALERQPLDEAAASRVESCPAP